MICVQHKGISKAAPTYEQVGSWSRVAQFPAKSAYRLTNAVVIDRVPVWLRHSPRKLVGVQEVSARVQEDIEHTNLLRRERQVSVIPKNCPAIEVNLHVL